MRVRYSQLEDIISLGGGLDEMPSIMITHTSKNGHFYFRWHDRHRYKGNFIVINVVDMREYLAAPICFEYSEIFRAVVIQELRVEESTL